MALGNKFIENFGKYSTIVLVEDNEIGYVDFNIEDMKVIIHLLKNHTSVTELTISDAFIDDNMFNELVSHIDDLHLKVLNVNANLISDKSVQYLAAKLKKNNCLEVIDLSENNISHVGASALAEMLFTNSVIKILKLKATDLDEVIGNPIGDIGAISFLNALQYNQTVTTLDISADNGITDTDLLIRIKNCLENNIKINHLKSEQRVYSNFKLKMFNNNKEDVDFQFENYELNGNVRKKRRIV